MQFRCLNRIIATVITVASPHVITAADDLTPLSTEFENSSDLNAFQRLYQTEAWGANQLQSLSVHTGEGRLVAIPHPSSWYQDYKGPLAYKNVTGDFVATVRVRVRNSAENAPANSPYSFGGILVRSPRTSVTSPGTWQAGQEDWIV